MPIGHLESQVCGEKNGCVSKFGLGPAQIVLWLFGWIFGPFDCLVVDFPDPQVKYFLQRGLWFPPGLLRLKLFDTEAGVLPFGVLFKMPDMGFPSPFSGTAV